MNLGNRAQSWATLEELHAQGKLKAIGVSNYTPKHMKELIQSCKVRPAVLQVSYESERRRDHVSNAKNIYMVCVLGFSQMSLRGMHMFYFSGRVSPTTVPDRAEECLWGVWSVFPSLLLFRERRAGDWPCSYGGSKELWTHSCTGNHSWKASE